MNFNELSDVQRNQFYECISSNTSTGYPSIEDIAKKFSVTPEEILKWKEQALNVASEGLNFTEAAIISSDSADDIDDAEEDYEDESGSIKDKVNSYLDRDLPDRPHNSPLSGTFKKCLWGIVGAVCVIALGFILYKPITNKVAEAMETEPSAAPKATAVVEKENTTPKAPAETTEKPTATPELTAVIKLKTQKVEIDYGAKYDPTTNVESVADNLGRVVSYVSNKADGKGWFYVVSNIDENKEGTQKVTVEVYYNDKKVDSQTFEVVVKPKPTPTPTPTPTPVPKKQQTVQQPAQSQTQPSQKAQPSQSQTQPQPAQEDENVDISQFGDGTESYDGHVYN